MDGSQNIFALSTNQQINSENIEENERCNVCARPFLTNRGLLQHLNVCRTRNMTNNSNQAMTTTNDDNNDNTSNSNNSNGNDIPDKIESQEKFYWNLVARSTFEKDLNNAYEKIVHWKKNFFMLPSGAAGKRYVEVTSHGAMDTRHTIGVNITESNSCYTDVTFQKTKKILKSQRSPST